MFYNRLLRKRDNSTNKIYSKDSFFFGYEWIEGHCPPYTARWKVIIIYICILNTFSIVFYEEQMRLIYIGATTTII